MLCAADVHPVHSVNVPVLGFDDGVVVTQPATTRLVISIITTLCGEFPTHPAGAGRHLPSGDCLFELLRQSTRQGLATVEKVALGIR